MKGGEGPSFLPPKTEGGCGEAGAEIPVGDDGNRGRGSGRGQAVQVKRARQRERKRRREEGRVRKMGINHRGRWGGREHRLPGLNLGLTLKNVPPPTHTHTPYLSHSGPGGRNPQSQRFLLPGCVCACVSSFSTPPTPPHPQAPSPPHSYC